MSDAAPFASLEGEHHVSLASYRRNGQAVPTAVWFALLDGALYARSMAEAGKVKRIRNSGDATVAVSDAAGVVGGPELPGTARILEDDDPLVASADAPLDEKYGERRRRLAHVRPRDARMVYLEVRPRA